jgi:hypothetical protein
MELGIAMPMVLMVFNTCEDMIPRMMPSTLKVPVWMTSGGVPIPTIQHPTSIKMHLTVLTLVKADQEMGGLKPVEKLTPPKLTKMPENIGDPNGSLFALALDSQLALAMSGDSRT